MLNSAEGSPGMNFIARLASYYYISKKFIADFLAYIVQNLDLIRYDGTPRLIHGDFMPGHIFVERESGEWKIIGIIDFEFAQAYAPEYDFIKLHRAGFFDDPDLKKALIESYGPISEEAIKIHRLIRDLGFAWAVLEAGDKKLSDGVLRSIEERLK